MSSKKSGKVLYAYILLILFIFVSNLVLAGTAQQKYLTSQCEYITSRTECGMLYEKWGDQAAHKCQWAGYMDIPQGTTDRCDNVGETGVYPLPYIYEMDPPVPLTSEMTPSSNDNIFSCDQLNSALTFEDSKKKYCGKFYYSGHVQGKSYNSIFEGVQRCIFEPTKNCAGIPYRVMTEVRTPVKCFLPCIPKEEVCPVGECETAGGPRILPITNVERELTSQYGYARIINVLNNNMKCSEISEASAGDGTKYCEVVKNDAKYANKEVCVQCIPKIVAQREGSAGGGSGGGTINWKLIFEAGGKIWLKDNVKTCNEKYVNSVPTEENLYDCIPHYLDSDGDNYASALANEKCLCFGIDNILANRQKCVGTYEEKKNNPHCYTKIRPWNYGPGYGEIRTGELWEYQDCDDNDIETHPGRTEDCIKAGNQDCDEYRDDRDDPDCGGKVCKTADAGNALFIWLNGICTPEGCGDGFVNLASETFANCPADRPSALYETNVNPNQQSVLVASSSYSMTPQSAVAYFHNPNNQNYYGEALEAAGFEQVGFG
ncbi:hypothetical protein HYW76_01635 [Candidatus Pacearchaeota archaeon]|nr:hypothetical protein [Candidatus Pacearchaeota archaeon]